MLTARRILDLPETAAPVPSLLALLSRSRFYRLAVLMFDKFVFAAIGNPMRKISGVVKLDVGNSEVERKECTVGYRMFGEGTLNRIYG